MRKVGGVLLAVAMVLPLAVMAAPSGAAGAGMSCTKLTGTVTFKPPLPKLGSTKKVTTTFSVKGGKLTGCTGPGGATGTVTLSAKTKTPGNCSTLANGSTNSGTETIKWAKGAASTLTVKLISPKASTNATVSGSVSKGQFKGKKTTASAGYTLPAGACSTKDLASAKISLKKGTKFVIK
jgi:hypothetical protein